MTGTESAKEGMYQEAEEPLWSCELCGSRRRVVLDKIRFHIRTSWLKQAGPEDSKAYEEIATLHKKCACCGDRTCEVTEIRSLNRVGNEKGEENHDEETNTET